MVGQPVRLPAHVVPNLPWALRNGIDRAEKIETHPWLFPELTGEAFAPGTRMRQRHPSRLRAISLLVQALLRRLDLRTLRVGDQRDDGLCSGVPLVKLQEHTGLSPSRLSRAIADLEAAGYITSKQPVEATSSYTNRRGEVTTYKGFPSVRTVAGVLLDRLRLGAKFSRARTLATDRWRRSHASPASARALLETRKAIRAAAAVARGKRNAVAYNAKLLQLREEHPDWPAERVRAEARRLVT